MKEYQRPLELWKNIVYNFWLAGYNVIEIFDEYDRLKISLSIAQKENISLTWFDIEHSYQQGLSAVTLNEDIK